MWTRSCDRRRGHRWAGRQHQRCPCRRRRCRRAWKLVSRVPLAFSRTNACSTNTKSSLASRSKAAERDADLAAAQHLDLPRLEQVVLAGEDPVEHTTVTRERVVVGASRRHPEDAQALAPVVLVSDHDELTAGADDVRREVDRGGARSEPSLQHAVAASERGAERAVGFVAGDPHRSGVGPVVGRDEEPAAVLRRERHSIPIGGEPRDAVARPGRVEAGVGRAARP